MKLQVKKRIRTQNDKDAALSLFIVVYLLMNAINSVFQDVFNFSGLRLTIVKGVITLLMLAFLFRPMVVFKKKEWLILLTTEVGCLFAYLWSAVLGVSADKLLGWMSTTLMVCVPIALAAAFIKDKMILYRYAQKFSWFIWLVLIVNLLGKADDLYDMHFSYGLLFVMLLHLNEYINTRKKIYIPCLLIQLFMLVSYGSRGALVCIVAFIVLKIFTNVKNKKLRNFYVVALIAITVAAYIILNTYSMEIYEWILSQGYYSRTIKLLLTGQFATHDSGRGKLWQTTIMLINQKPIAGWGIRGAVSEMGHPYPHNLFLDCILTFGIPLGTLMIITFLIPLHRVITATRSIDKDLMQILFSIGFVCMMFSSTFFTNYYFFLFYGLLLSTKKSKKVKLELRR